VIDSREHSVIPTTVVALLHRVPIEAVFAPQAVFLADASSTLARRIWRHEDWTETHRSHIYQRLNQLGWSHVQVTLALTLLMAIIAGLGAVSITASTLLRSCADLTLLALLVGYLASPRIFRPAALAADRSQLMTRS
jgi:UDP-GlcNAc:undecaprenyl-phosphate/decaprenyl-phosphate GlcNAc-1-phosphate transferase